MTKARARHLLKTYGITLEQYLTLLAAQNFSCAVCGKHESHFKKSLHVDHNHATGEVRGLLCFSCNNRVIGRHTDPELMHNAYLYLLNGHTGWFVPEKPKKRRRRVKLK